MESTAFDSSNLLRIHPARVCPLQLHLFQEGNHTNSWYETCDYDYWLKVLSITAQKPLWVCSGVCIKYYNKWALVVYVHEWLIVGLRLFSSQQRITWKLWTVLNDYNWWVYLYLCEFWTAFAWLRCNKVTDCQAFLKKKGIITRSGRYFGAGLEYVRLSMLERSQSFEILVDRLAKMDSARTPDWTLPKAAHSF